MATQDLASHLAEQQGAEDKLYNQVALRISELIEHGTLRPGARMPSVRKLSEQEEVSIATVMQAYRVLESKGLRRRCLNWRLRIFWRTAGSTIICADCGAFTPNSSNVSLTRSRNISPKAPG
ncbi:MAG: hypothetical protein DME21_11305 [Verrucomicrobia bacterium]|nr:MAG: hypothetical protein DME21_11305 [Verrucomicrobiota bacterium]